MIQAESNRTTFSNLWPLGAGVSDRSLRTRPQQAFLGILLIIGVTAVLCLYLFQTSRITVTNFGITHLQRDYERLQRENSNMLASYAHEQSIAQMKKRALAAGFGPPADLEYVTIAPKTETGQPATVDALPETSSSLSQNVRQQTAP